MSPNLQLAREHFQQRDFQRAVRFAQSSLEEDASDVRAWLILGHALMRLRDHVGAIDALENASILQPIDIASRVELAITYGAVGRKALSRDLLMSIATKEQANASELIRIAAGLEAVDEPVLAMEACRQAGKRLPDSAEVHYQMGYYAQLCGHPSHLCEALIRRAIHLEPENLHFRIGLASLLIRLGRKTEAIELLHRAIPRQLAQVTCECCLRRIANLFFDNGDIDRARQCAERLAELHSSPSDVSSYAAHDALEAK